MALVLPERHRVTARSSLTRRPWGGKSPYRGGQGFFLPQVQAEHVSEQAVRALGLGDLVSAMGFGIVGHRLVVSFVACASARRALVGDRRA